MREYAIKPTIMTSVRITPEFHELCYKHHIRFSEAMRVGISILLAERGIKDYDNDLNIFRRLTKIRHLLEEKSQELEDLKEKAQNKA